MTHATDLIGLGPRRTAFDILRVHSIDVAIEWATRQAEVLGDVEMDIRPVTEASWG